METEKFWILAGYFDRWHMQVKIHNISRKQYGTYVLVAPENEYNIKHIVYVYSSSPTPVSEYNTYVTGGDKSRTLSSSIIHM